MIVTLDLVKNSEFIKNAGNIYQFLVSDKELTISKGKIGYNHYLLAVKNEYITPLEHVNYINKLKDYLKKETITHIWKKLIGYASYEDLHELQSEKVIDFILVNSTYNKYLLYSDIYSKFKQVINSSTNIEVKNYKEEVSLDLKKIPFSMLSLFFEEISFFINCKTIIDNERTSKEFKFRFINNILIFMSNRTAYIASKIFYILSNYFNDNTIFCITIKEVLLKIAKHWNNESIISTIIGALCNTNIENYNIILQLLREDQICLLKTIINYLYNVKPYEQCYVRDPRKYRAIGIVNINSYSTLLKIEENVTKLFYVLKEHHCKSQEGIVKPMFSEDFVENEGICENISFTIQGINEIFLNETLHCKELKEPALLNYRPSKIMCKDCYLEYKETCKEVQSCNPRLTVEENNYRKNVIQTCLYKRLIHTHMCNYNVDKGHIIKKSELEQMLDKCQFSI